MQTGLSDCDIPAKCGKKRNSLTKKFIREIFCPTMFCSWCTTKTSKVLKTLERRFAGFSLGHIKVGIAEKKKLRPLKFGRRILLFQAALWF